jgi:hypothetical protein
MFDQSRALVWISADVGMVAYANNALVIGVIVIRRNLFFVIALHLLQRRMSKTSGIGTKPGKTTFWSSHYDEHTDEHFGFAQSQ